MLDPFEIADLVIGLENVWSTETSVTAQLSVVGCIAADPCPVTAAGTVVAYGDIAQGSVVDAAHEVTVGDIDGHEWVLFRLDLDSSGAMDPAARYFWTEIGSLENGTATVQRIQDNDWDEFHAWHFDVPAGALDLSIATTTIGGRDIDLLVRFGEPPQYYIDFFGGGFAVEPAFDAVTGLGNGGERWIRR